MSHKTISFQDGGKVLFNGIAPLFPRVRIEVVKGAEVVFHRYGFCGTETRHGPACVLSSASSVPLHQYEVKRQATCGFVDTVGGPGVGLVNYLERDLAMRFANVIREKALDYGDFFDIVAGFLDGAVWPLIAKCRMLGDKAHIYVSPKVLNYIKWQLPVYFPAFVGVEWIADRMAVVSVDKNMVLGLNQIRWKITSVNVGGDVSHFISGCVGFGAGVVSYDGTALVKDIITGEASDFVEWFGGMVADCSKEAWELPSAQNQREKE